VLRPPPLPFLPPPRSLCTISHTLEIGVSPFVVSHRCVIGDGVRIEGSTLLEGTQVCSNTLIKDSLLGWRCVVGGWSHVVSSVFGEDVHVEEGLLVREATVLPHKELCESIRTEQIVI
jgi:NDP-sugar pyrophosphorylase family protein